ncbi:unnamed protein product [Lactuca virosa]|uniref:Uncharacterized protein n=1 Tax=Lactuca virosa TaxID=75947 RepID=A0AAU9PT97_9ASTR|nr:unnamed protein product [Lactuca virosa]
MHPQVEQEQLVQIQGADPAPFENPIISLDAFNERETIDLLSAMIENVSGRFLTRVEVVGSMLQIVEAETLEEGTKHLAIEFMISLAEVREGTWYDLSIGCFASVSKGYSLMLSRIRSQPSSATSSEYALHGYA